MNPATSRLNDVVEMVNRPMLRPEGTCSHIMAIQFDPAEGSDLGVIRCIDSREGRVHVPGFVDRSKLRVVEVDSLYTAEIREPVEIEDSTEVVTGLDEFGADEFLGFEDPILRRYPGDETLHLYCTIPFYDPTDERSVMYLGHASGDDLFSLRMHEPVLGPVDDVHDGAKEPAIAPTCSAGYRRNLVESNDVIDGTNYSVLRTVIARQPGAPWEYDDLVLHPARDGHEWCGGHVSPGPMFPRSFVDVGERRRVGLLNGREANRRDGDVVTYGTFTIGLFVYDFEEGTVEWFSDEPLIEDPAARTITFASAFRHVDDDRVAIYAHVDDSFIRVYQIDADALATHLREEADVERLQAPQG